MPASFAGPLRYAGGRSQGRSRSSSGSTSSPPTTRGWTRGRPAGASGTTSRSRSSGSRTRGSRRSPRRRRRRARDTTSSASCRRRPSTRTTCSTTRTSSGGRACGRPATAARQAKHVQPEDEAVLRHLRQLRAEPGALAARRLGIDRRVAGELGSRQDGGAEAARARAPDRDRAVGGARLERRPHEPPHVLRLVPADRGQRPGDRLAGDRRRGAVHGGALEKRPGQPRLLLDPASNNQFLLSGEGSLVMNAISGSHRRDARAAVQRRISGSGRSPPARRAGSRSASTRASTRSGSSRRTRHRAAVPRRSLIDARQATVASLSSRTRASRGLPEGRSLQARDRRSPPAAGSTRSSRRSPSSTPATRLPPGRRTPP